MWTRESGREARRAANICALVLLLVSIHPAARAQSERSYAELPNFHRVNERVYRGAQPRDGGLERLRALGVKTIISLRGESDEEEARRLGLNYFHLPMSRFRRPSRERLERVMAIINAPENWPVFVHCQRGIDRTGTVIASYRVTQDEWTPPRAAEEAETFNMRWWFERGLEDYLDDFLSRRLPSSPSSQTIDDDDDQ